MRLGLRSAARVALAAALCVAAAAPAGALAQKPWKRKKEKHFEPAARQNVRDYAGRYVGVEGSYRIDLRVGDDGRLTGASTEGGREAALEDVSVEGGTLTATRVYADGRRAPLVATFVDRVLNGDRAFGLMVENVRIELPGLTLTRVFYRRADE